MSEFVSDLENRQYHISFDVAKSMRYHAYRRSFFDRLDKLVKVASIGTGGATFLFLASSQETWWATVCALLVTSLTAFDTIIGFGNVARAHDKLYRDFTLLAREIARTTELSEAKLAEWAERRLEIEMEEPGTMDWLERVCSREEAVARGAEVNDAWNLPRWKVRLSQFVPG